jgi:GT2 family glycosyltransferase
MEWGDVVTRMVPIAAVVVNWNRCEDTLRCLASLAATDYPALTTFLVDNASTDGSSEAVRRAFPAVRLIENRQNLGFAEGNNVALREALAEGFPYVLLLNNDATIAPDAIRLLLQPLLDDPTVGLSGPAICYTSEPHRLWSAGGSIDWRRGVVTSPWCDRPLAALPEHPFVVDHISGCAMLIRAKAIAEAGLLDARFFMYYEETEWCARIARLGYRIVVVPAARVWHAISPRTQEGSPAIAYYMTRNQLLFLRATRAGAGAWANTLYRQLRTIASLYLARHSPERIRGRWPMVLALRDFARGRFGPTTLPRMLR